MKSPLGVFLYGALTGVIGIAILLLFFSMVLSPSLLLFILPFIVAFNGAAGGYSLTDRVESGFPYQKLTLVCLAALLTVTGCSLITLFVPWEPLMDGGRYIISGLSTLVSTFFGSWIAAKSKGLNT
ncbi:MAG: hypothetical protein WBB19_19080 [Desulforhopalus sp.]